jgi:poly(A) polymerase
MKSFFSILKKQELLKEVFKFAKKRKIRLYLVGGILRDLLLGRDKENLDFDFCLKKGAINFGKKLAKKIKAGFVVLDKEHGACRLVKKAKDRIYTLDFTDFRDKTLKKDLGHRDFTINSIALRLEDVFVKENLEQSLLDPYTGIRDLKLKTIRIANKKAFDEDPLRILRAFSLSAIFGFEIEKSTLRLAKLKANKLSKISYERIRDELFKILDTPSSYNYLVELDRLKILQNILPEIEVMRGLNQGPYHHLDIWQHTLQTIKELEKVIQEFKDNKDIQRYLSKVISGDRRRLTLVKLGALLHDIGKPASMRREEGKIKFHGHEKIGSDIAEDIARRLKLSNDELDSLRKMIFWHLRPGYLADNPEVSARAAFRYFRDTAQEAVSTLLISLGDQRATGGSLTTKKSRMQHEKIVAGLIKEYFRKEKQPKLSRLITGDDLIKKFKLTPSPLIGRMLREIEELQAIGKIKNKTEAFQVVRRYA